MARRAWNSRSLLGSVALLASWVLATAVIAAEPGGTVPAKMRERARVAEAYGKLPLSFEVNRGQSDATVDFLARANKYTVFLTSGEAVLVLRRVPAGAPQWALLPASVPASSEDPTVSVVRLKLRGANPRPAVVALDELSEAVSLVGSR